MCCNCSTDHCLCCTHYAYLKAKYINWMLRIIYCRSRNINLSTTKVYFLFSKFIQHMYISKLFNCQHGLKLKPKQTCLMCGPKKTVIGFFIKYAVLYLKINLLPIGIPIYIYLHLKINVPFLYLPLNWAIILL